MHSWLILYFCLVVALLCTRTKHSTLIYSRSCYSWSHRFWLPVHTLFSITSLSFVSHFIVSLVRIWRERVKTCLYVHLILVVAMSVQITLSWVFFGILSLRLTKTILKPKKKRPCKRSSRLSGGLLVSEFFQSEKQRSLDDQRHRSDGLRWANRKSIVTQSLKERAIFPVPVTVQDFDRRSNPNCPFNHAQANLTKQEQGRRLHEKFFALGVNNRRFLSRKTKPCEKLKKTFLFAFGHRFFSFVLFFFTFHRRSVEIKTDLAMRQKSWKPPDVQ